jgi:hypothetical protein
MYFLTNNSLKIFFPRFIKSVSSLPKLPEPIFNIFGICNNNYYAFTALCWEIFAF